MNKKENKLVDFFKLMGLYNQKAFDYINKNKVNLFNNRLNNELENYGINTKLEGKKLKSFEVVVPSITNEKNMLINIYLYAKALLYYNKLGKDLVEENTMEILPTSLVRIYSDLNLNNSMKKKISVFQENKVMDLVDEKLLLAYDLQFLNSNNYMRTGILLIPENFYVDNVNILKESCLRKLRDNDE